MDEIPVSVDLNKLRTVANRVEQSAQTLSRFRMPELSQADLPGSAVTKLPVVLANYFDNVIEEMTAWARVARASADALDRTEQKSATRLAES